MAHLPVIIWLYLSIGNWVLYKRGSDGDDSYLKFIIKFRKKIYILLNFILWNFLVRTLQYFLKNLKKNFWLWKLKKNWPQKLHTYGSLDFFFSAAPTAQNVPRLKIHIGNVSQDTIVCWSVDRALELKSNKKTNYDFLELMSPASRQPGQSKQLLLLYDPIHYALYCRIYTLTILKLHCLIL